MNGSVSYDRGTWIVECAPHISMRLKRVFGKLGKFSHGKHRITDTPENARDLEWFLQRYPMAVADPERLRAGSATHEERTALVEALLSGTAEHQHFELAVPARHYQEQAAAVLLARGGLLLGDDVGIGKTAASICALTDPRTRPALVVTLTHLPRQWRTELNKFAPGLNVHIIKQGTVYELVKQPKPGQLKLLAPPVAIPDVIIINYHKLTTWAETLSKICRSVIFDEVQELRRNESAKWRAAHHIATSVKFRMGLSATPIYNYGGEMYNVLACLFPHEIGSRQEFAIEWCGGATDDKASISDPKAFGAYLRSEGLMLRRTRSDVGRELPPIQKVPHVVESDPAALKRVSESCAELANLILSDADHGRGVKMRASEEFSNRLRQATGIAKAPYVAEFVRMLLETGEKVVLYGWHREFYSIILDRLAEFKPAMYTGEESPGQKEFAKTRFVSGDTNLLIISLRAGAGLDGLQSVCRTVVFGELDWSPGVHEQCEGRINRDGQKDPVVAYYLLAEDGADPIISEVLGLKRQQIEGIRDLNADLIEKLQNDGGHVRRLAEAYLGRKAERQPEAEREAS